MCWGKEQRSACALKLMKSLLHVHTQKIALELPLNERKAYSTLCAGIWKQGRIVRWPEPAFVISSRNYQLSCTLGLTTLALYSGMINCFCYLEVFFLYSFLANFFNFSCFFVHFRLKYFAIIYNFIFNQYMR